jgi:microsomal epoxide hydrolase
VVHVLALFASSAERAAAQATTRTFAQSDLVKPFRVQIDQRRIDSILERVRTAKLPRQMPPTPGATSAWETGADVQWLEGLRRYWTTQFNWRAAEARLNRYPQYKARVDGVDIHFYYVQGEGSNPLPLLLTHGWPGSVVEFLDVIGPLTQPSKHGGRAEDAFTVIIPSLPGYAFSSLLNDMGIWNATARLWHKLVTEVIGYEQYVAQGGDVGSEITVLLAYRYPRNVKAIHLNLLPWGNIPAGEQTPEEKAWATNGDAYMAAEFDYLRLQVNKPMMPSVALSDSPMGTAAWIAEKFWAWSDNNGDLEKTVSKDHLLTNIMLYLLSDSGVEGSFRFYRAIRDELRWGSCQAGSRCPRRSRSSRASTPWAVRLSKRRSAGTTSFATPRCRVADTSLRWSSQTCSSMISAKASGPLAKRYGRGVAADAAEEPCLPGIGHRKVDRFLGHIYRKTTICQPMSSAKFRCAIHLGWRNMEQSSGPY